jgi:hypothetical protein
MVSGSDDPTSEQMGSESGPTVLIQVVDDLIRYGDQLAQNQVGLDYSPVAREAAPTISIPRHNLFNARQ